MIPEDIFSLTPGLPPAMTTASAKAAFLRLAHNTGFQLAGVATARPVDDFPIYNQWLADGLAGPLHYLSDHRAQLRSDPRSLLPSARSVLCLGLLYNTPGPAHHSVSRYAWGPADYHDILRASLLALATRLHEACGPFDYRLCVDTAPILERSLARQAGLGWIGRNTCLINQPLGSWFFLGEILTSLDLPPDSPPPDRCGSCRRCIDACPTQALVGTPDGRTRLDAARCISTWTIEQRGPLPEPHRAASGHHLFGCDICQDVCPWNQRAPFSSESGFQALHPNPSLAELAALSPEDFRQRFRHTPLYRAKHSGLLRNAVTAMGNSSDPSYLPALRRLAALDDPAIRSHALWAIQRLEQLP